MNMKRKNEADLPQQLTLSVKLRQDSTFGNFLGAANSKNSHILTHALSTEEPFVYLCGEQGSGKTHLLNACCNTLEAQNKRVMFISLYELEALSANLFDELEAFDAVILDDIDALFENPETEIALFDLYNRLKAAEKILIVSASDPVAKQRIGLADLRSRLGAGLLLQLLRLTDDEKMCALQSRAQDKGFFLGDDVAAYIMKRSGRNLGELFSVLEQLDDASLSAKRLLTVPFVKSVLGW
jgi:DnaA family protein